MIAHLMYFFVNYTDLKNRTVVITKTITTTTVVDENGNPVDAATDAVPPAAEKVDNTADAGVGVAGRTFEGATGGGEQSSDGAGSSNSSSGSGSGDGGSTDGGGGIGGNFDILERGCAHIGKKPGNILFLKPGQLF